MLYLPQTQIFLVQTSKRLLLDHQRKAHRLHTIIEHHTSIHAIIHEANNRTKLEQYTKHMKQQSKKVLKTFYTLLRTHRRKKHTNQSYGAKEITTVGFILYEKKKTIGFIYFNYI
jgi:hypothetical protein